jgi:acetyltransferase
MSAARHFAKTKPIIVVKSGRTARSALAAAVAHRRHRRRRHPLQRRLPPRRRGARRRDRRPVRRQRGAVARLEPARAQARHRDQRRRARRHGLRPPAGPGRRARRAGSRDRRPAQGCLPSFAARGNPVDVGGDADAERYAAAAAALMDDPNCDGVLAILTPQAMSYPTQTAEALIEVAKRHVRKPLLTSFMGEIKVAEGIRLLRTAHVPTFDTPEDAVRAYLYMYQYTKSLANLYETPADILPQFTPDREASRRSSSRSRARALDPQRDRGQGRARGLRHPGRSRRCSPPPPRSAPPRPKRSAFRWPSRSSPRHHPQVRRGRHRPERALRPRGRQAVHQDHRARPCEGQARGQDPGRAVQAMSRGGYEVIIGSRKDRTFGPALMFGMGGTGVELYRDVAVDFPPLNQALARTIISDTKVSQAAARLPRRHAGRHGRPRAGAGQGQLPAGRLPRDPRDGRQPAAGAPRRPARARRARHDRAQGRAQDHPARLASDHLDVPQQVRLGDPLDDEKVHCAPSGPKTRTSGAT